MEQCAVLSGVSVGQVESNLRLPSDCKVLQRKIANGISRITISGGPAENKADWTMFLVGLQGRCAATMLTIQGGFGDLVDFPQDAVVLVPDCIGEQFNTRRVALSDEC